MARGAGEPQDRDRGDVVRRADVRPQVLVREVGEARPLASPPGSKAAAGISKVVTNELVHQEHAHDHRGRGEQLAGAADPAERAPAWYRSRHRGRRT